MKPQMEVLLSVALLLFFASALSGCAKFRASTDSLESASQAADADEIFSGLDPKLYAAAKKYFPADEVALPQKRIFRLTRVQFDSTVKSLLPAYATSVMSLVPRDPLQTNYEYAEIININPSNFTPLNDWIQLIVAKVRANPVGVINCASAMDTACLQLQTRHFLLKAFRGDITEDRIVLFTKLLTDGVVASGIPDAAADLVDVVLSSPQFLYRLEFHADVDGKLIAPEYLQSLTYTLADAPPEKLKLSSLDPEASVRTAAQVKVVSDQIIGTLEAREKLVRFFSSWLEVKEPTEFTISPTDFPEFTPAVAEAVVKETNQFLTFHLTKAAPNLKDLTQSTKSFVSPASAPLYDLNPNGLTGANLVELDASRRLGIFAQSAVIASHSGPTSTRLVKRGVFWVRKVMCQEMAPPPSGTDTMIPEAPNTTERQRIEGVTNRSACIGCHRVINPFGFFQEAYDPIGKWRTTDNGFPVDTSLSTNILDEGQFSTNQPVEALKTFTSSVMFKQCFVRQLFRFYMGRNEVPEDHKLLREMFFYFADGDKQEIVPLLQILANSNRLSHRM